MSESAGEPVSESAQGAGSNFVHVRLIYVIALNVLQHTLKNSQLCIGIVCWLLGSGGDPATDDRVESQCC